MFLKDYNFCEIIRIICVVFYFQNYYHQFVLVTVIVFSQFLLYTRSIYFF